MYIKIETKTTPPSLTVNAAAKDARCSKVYVTNKISDNTLDYGYLHDHGEENRGQKVVILNKKWDNFLKQTLNSKSLKSKSLWITKEIARQDLKLTDGMLTKYIMDGELEYDYTTNKIKKDHKYYGLLNMIQS